MVLPLKDLADFPDAPASINKPKTSSLEVLLDDLDPSELARQITSYHHLPHVSYSILNLWLKGALPETELEEYLKYMKVHYYACKSCQSMVESYKQRKALKA